MLIDLSNLDEERNPLQTPQHSWWQRLKQSCMRVVEVVDVVTRKIPVVSWIRYWTWDLATKSLVVMKRWRKLISAGKSRQVQGEAGRYITDFAMINTAYLGAKFGIIVTVGIYSGGYALIACVVGAAVGKYISVASWDGTGKLLRANSEATFANITHYVKAIPNYFIRQLQARAFLGLFKDTGVNSALVILGLNQTIIFALLPPIGADDLARGLYHTDPDDPGYYQIALQSSYGLPIAWVAYGVFNIVAFVPLIRALQVGSFTANVFAMPSFIKFAFRYIAMQGNRVILNLRYTSRQVNALELAFSLEESVRYMNTAIGQSCEDAASLRARLIASILDDAEKRQLLSLNIELADADLDEQFERVLKANFIQYVSSDYVYYREMDQLADDMEPIDLKQLIEFVEAYYLRVQTAEALLLALPQNSVQSVTDREEVLALIETAKQVFLLDDTADVESILAEAKKIYATYSHMIVSLAGASQADIVTDSSWSSLAKIILTPLAFALVVLGEWTYLGVANKGVELLPIIYRDWFPLLSKVIGNIRLGSTIFPVTVSGALSLTVMTGIASTTLPTVSLVIDTLRGVSPQPVYEGMPTPKHLLGNSIWTSLVSSAPNGSLGIILARASGVTMWGQIPLCFVAFWAPFLSNLGPLLKIAQSEAQSKVLPDSTDDGQDVPYLKLYHQLIKTLDDSMQGSLARLIVADPALLEMQAAMLAVSIHGQAYGEVLSKPRTVRDWWCRSRLNFFVDQRDVVTTSVTLSDNEENNSLSLPLLTGDS